MSGRLNESATTIAAWLLAGATAEVVGGELLQGEPIRYWIDDKEQAHPLATMKESQPGVLLTRLDGSRALYATLDREAAESLLARAREVPTRGFG